MEDRFSFWKRLPISFPAARTSRRFPPGSRRNMPTRSPLEAAPSGAKAQIFLCLSRTLYCKVVSVLGMLSIDAQPQSETCSLLPDQKRALVQRVLNSRSFSRSPAMRSFLLYITEQTISESGGSLKEQTIGVEVLGRKPNYDPTEDNIVRVRAHELRARLAKYFETEGAEEPVIVHVPKGCYAPEFLRRSVALANPVTPAAPAPAPEIQPAKHPVRGVLPLVAIVLATSLVTFLLTLWIVNLRERTAASAGPALQDFWGQFFNHSNQELRVVYADTNFALWQDLHGKTLNLGDYLSQQFLDEHEPLREVASRRSTSPADLSVTAQLATLVGGFGARLAPKFARGADVEFLRNGNVVLVGSRRSNPWVEVYEPNLNFRLEQDAHSGAPGFRNLSPRPSEAPLYPIPAMLDTAGDEQRELTSYGLVALLAHCGGRGFVVLDEGLNMQATQAVGDILTDEQQLNTLLQSIGHKPGTKVVPFEALIQIRSLPGSYNSPETVAYRLRPAGSCVGN